jgi:hypothetical protein
MPKAGFIKDSCYPVYAILSDNETHDGDVVIELTEAEIKWLRAATDEFWQAQELVQQKVRDQLKQDKEQSGNSG